MRASRLGVLGLGSLFAAAACGGGGDGGGGPNGGAGMTAKINANSWAATQVQVSPGSPQVPGTVIITGTKVSGSSTSTISLLLGFIAGPGTYPLGVNQATIAGGTGLLLETTPASAENRTTPFSGAGGTVVITSLSATHLTGTFAFVAEPILGSTFTGNKTISDGVLDIDLPSAITTVPAANHGSSVLANLGGTPFNSATVVGLGSAGSFSFGANTDSLSLSFVTATPVTATGTYPFLTGINLSVTDLKKNHNWGGVSGDAGSVIVTSVANGRVAGTFSGTLHSLSQGLADLTISNGSFDVRIDPSP
jgi:hypothetical protein